MPAGALSPCHLQGPAQDANRRRSRLDEVVELLGIQIVPVTFEEAQVARSAHADFGKGSGHPARLNVGDVFSYAPATVTREPLLFKGDDFRQTDVTPAL